MSKLVFYACTNSTNAHYIYLIKALLSFRAAHRQHNNGINITNELLAGEHLLKLQNFMYGR